MKIMFVVFGVLFGLLSWAESPGLEDGAWVTGRLENGLRYFIRPNGEPENRLELRLAVNVGSVLEEEDQRGVAHFLEHIAFNGSEHFERNELVTFLESLGVGFGPDLNAYTSFDETVYQLRLPTDVPEAVEKGFLILSDWAGRVTNADEAVEAERGVVIEEWRGRRGAQARVMDQQYPLLFGGSRYAERLPIGKLEVLQAFPPQRLRDFYRDWYRPELMSVIAVGDLDVEETRARIEELFGALKGVEGGRERTEYTHPLQGGTEAGVFSDPELTGSEVSVFWKMPPRPALTEQAYRDRIREAVVADMLSQRLREMTQQADAPFLEAGAYRGGYTRGGDVYLLYASVKDESGAHLRAARTLLEESERARRHGFSQGEMERAAARRLREVEREYQERESTPSDVFIREMVRHALTGEYLPSREKDLELHREVLASLQVEALQDLFRSWTGPENRVILAEGPSRDGETRLPEPEALKALFAEVEAREFAPYEDGVSDQPLVAQVPVPGKVVAREEIPELGVWVWTLSNGAKVMLKPTDFKRDEVLFRAWSPGGTNAVPVEELPNARPAAAVARAGGLGVFSAVDLEKKLAGRLVSMAPRIGADQDSLQGSASAADLETLLQLVYLTFMEPREDVAAFDALRGRMREEVGNRLSDPRAEFGDLVAQSLTGGDPRQAPPTLADVEALDMSAALSFFRGRFATASDFHFLFVGSFSPEAVEPWMCQWIGSLPAGPADPRLHLAEPWPRHELRRVMRRGVEPVGQVIMAWTLPEFDFTFARRHALRSMTAALNIRLREKVREKLGGSYHVSIAPDIRAYPEARARVMVQFGCDPARVEEMIGAVEGVVAAATEELLPAHYVQTVQETQRRTREVDLRENAFWAEVLPFYEWHREDPRHLLELETYIEKVTAESIREEARKAFLTPDRSVFILLPADSSSPEPPR